jgi:serine protease Do
MIRSRDEGIRLAGAALLAALVAIPAPLAAQERENRVIVGPSGQNVSVFFGPGAYLGVSITDVNDELASEAGLTREYGAYISSVVDEGPASQAGVREGDVIIGWNGQRVESAAQLQRFVRETPAGREVALTVMRSGDERTISVELGDRRDQVQSFTLPGGRIELRRDADAPRLVRPEGRIGRSMVFSRRGRLGVSLQSMGDQLASYFQVDGGALVSEVAEDSPAEAAGLRAGDVIVEFDGESVDDPSDLIRLLADIESGPVDLRVIRDGASRTLSIDVPEAGDREFGGFGDVGVFRFDGDGPAMFQSVPFGVESLEFGPMEFEFEPLDLEFGPMDWEFEMPADWGGRFDVRIPRFDVGDIEIPAIELPRIEVPRLYGPLTRRVIDA